MGACCRKSSNTDYITDYITPVSDFQTQNVNQNEYPNAGRCYFITPHSGDYMSPLPVVSNEDIVVIEETENLAGSEHSIENIWNTDDVSVELPTVTHQHLTPLHFSETEPSNAMNETENVESRNTTNFQAERLFIPRRRRNLSNFENTDVRSRSTTDPAESGNIRNLLPDIGRELSHGFNESSEEGNREPPWVHFVDPENSNIFLNENCSICCYNYNEENKQPRIIPCGHVICNECLNTLASENQFTTMNCPFDRQVFRLTTEQRTGMYKTYSHSLINTQKDNINIYKTFRFAFIICIFFHSNRNRFPKR